VDEHERLAPADRRLDVEFDAVDEHQRERGKRERGKGEREK
jgi:hypothetical protein